MSADAASDGFVRRATIDFKYRPDVDGLRAIAVLMVILFHAGWGFPGGYIGVDVFFVISGFLITGLIRKEQESGHFRLATFWVRRIRRIIPAATVMVVATVAAGYFLLLPADYADLGASAIAQQMMLANVYFWKNTGYFDGPADLKPLLHTWSLAVEEQFYLGYPFLLMLLKPCGRRNSAMVLGLLALASLVASEYGIRHHASAAFYMLPTRAWELLIGGLICFLPRPARVPPIVLTIASWLALGGIVAAGCLFARTTPFPGARALVPCGAAALLIYANSARLTPPAALLATRPFVFVGLISYSLYLFHWPILAYARYRFGESLDTPTTFAALATAVTLALLSWRFVETPLRRGRMFASGRLVTGLALASFCAVCLTGNLIRSNGLRGRFSDDFLQIVEVPYAGRDAGARGSLEEGWELPVLGDAESAPQKPQFVLWGDSYVKCLSTLVDEVARDYGIVGLDAGLGGTPPLVGSWTGTETNRKAESFNELVLEKCEKEQIEWLILFAAWDIHANGMSRLRDSEGGNSFEAFQRGFERTLAEAERLGMKVVVITQPPYQWESVPPKVAMHVLGQRTGSVHGVSRSKYLEYQRKSREFFSSFGDRITLIDAEEHCFDDNGLSLIGHDRVPYYSDAGHPSREGVRVFFSQPLENLFRAIAQR